MRLPTRRRILKAAAGAAALSLLPGCNNSSASTPTLTLYTSVDEPVARPIIQSFEQSHSLKVNLVADAEAFKTAGLAARLEAERSNPHADVWWSNEIFHTINLAAAGVLAAYASSAASQIPAQFKDPQSRWSATALRARVIAIAPSLIDRIKSLDDLTDPSLKDQICMANPAAGTTQGHMAALYTRWGKPKTESFLAKLKANNIALLAGNSDVAVAVGQGSKLAGLTDNDDVDSMLREGGKLKAILPDQGEGGIGTLMIPCSVSLVAGAKKPEPARKLIDYLLTPEVEQKLIAAKFAAYSVFATSNRPKPMPVDYTRVAANFTAATELALTLLGGRQ